jgi:flagellar basal body-associated protein FliL
VRFSSAAASGPDVAYTFPLETFVVNLSGGGRSYLRVGIALGLSHAPARKEDLPVAIVRDTILSIISAVKPEELAQTEGKERLKGQILQALKDRLPHLGVEDVYFTEFLVQM